MTAVRADVTVDPLALETVTVRFGDFVALHDVTLRVRPGERLAIIGPNGAGKSTLFNVMTGWLRPTDGRVHVFGEDVTGWRVERIVRRGVGRSFQQASVFPDFTVSENLQFGLLAGAGRVGRAVGLAVRAFRREAESLAAAVGIADLLDTPAGQLSHGDERSLELALALAQEPRLLLLDEPTAGMAPEETQRAMQLVQRLADERDLTLVFTEHDMEVVFGIATRVVVLAQGGLIADGPPAEIRTSDVVRKVYLGNG